MDVKGIWKSESPNHAFKMHNVSVSTVTKCAPKLSFWCSFTARQASCNTVDSPSETEFPSHLFILLHLYVASSITLNSSHNISIQLYIYFSNMCLRLGLSPVHTSQLFFTWILPALYVHIQNFRFLKMSWEQRIFVLFTIDNHSSNEKHF